MAVRVLLVDDVSELRAVVRQALRLRGGFSVVAEAADGTTAITAAAHHQPDVVVLDLGLPDLAGHEVVAGLRKVAPEAQVVVFTGSVTADRADVLGRVEAFVRKEQDVGYLIDLLADLGRDRRRAATMHLDPDLANVSRARRFVADSCARWGCSAALDDAELVVSELVTNALVHAATPCELRLRFVRDVLRFEVEDRGAGAPDVQAADDSSEHGRGLVLVSALCIAWGIDGGTNAAKVVWAELHVPREPDAPGDGNPPSQDLSTRDRPLVSRDPGGGKERADSANRTESRRRRVPRTPAAHAARQAVRA